MRGILSNVITASVGLPGKAKLLQHISIMSFDLAEMITKAMFPGYTFADDTVYILQGATNSTTDPIFTVGDGIAYLNGELFFFDAATFTAADLAVVVINTTYFTGSDGDPHTLTDGSTANVLSIRRMSVIDGNGSSTGFVANYDDVVFLEKIWITPTLLNGWTGTLKYYVDYKTNKVYTKGTLDSTTATNSIVFNFGASIRPDSLYSHAVKNVTDTSIALFTISSSGNLVCDIGYATSKAFSGLNMNWDF